jgi:hypothetical protein
MMNRNARWIVTGSAAVASMMIATTLGGCAEDAPPQVVVDDTPPPPPPPPRPSVHTIEHLMAELGIDRRIVLPENRAPGTNEARVAVLQFFDTMVKGEHEELGLLLSAADKLALDELVDAGTWQPSIASIKRVEIQTGSSPAGDPAALAIIEVDTASGTDFRPQLWYYQPGQAGYTFTAVATPPGIMAKLSGEDWIEAWHRILQEDLALAELPDTPIKEPKMNYDKSGQDGGAGPSGGGPSEPSMPGRRTPPRTPPYRPPGP